MNNEQERASVEARYAGWKAPETGATEQKIEKVELTDPAEIRAALNNLYKENLLITHQTTKEAARQIVDGGGYFHGQLQGTTLLQDPETISVILPELDKDSGRNVVTHMGSDGMVVMTFPRRVINQMIETGGAMSSEGVGNVDLALSDLVENKQIDEFGLPNQFMYGYYGEGKMHLNPGFNPAEPESWKDIKFTGDPAKEINYSEKTGESIAPPPEVINIGESMVDETVPLTSFKPEDLPPTPDKSNITQLP